MKIKFCGASTGVTGSCHMITTDKHKILLDCGQFQGGKAMEAMNREPFPLRAFRDRVCGAQPCPYRPLRTTSSSRKEGIQREHILY